ncbi:Smr/MutS family protein [Alterisphingorhabdus coralli]|uniref:Smr/MutS family protein n=1 Tax=Alterisphingorhabdus coralli TaxID=3071408 RepID=A0AA97I192_9SPHN|nr:Smr/MutS family protein [Parasphingorhabdus sp. SCSIO 66989]WOE75045.1 Smr/MutS family protein [Parasphingorhabdus sp. SCSIO 66989]
MSKRPLSDAEAALWQRLIATVTPLEQPARSKPVPDEYRLQAPKPLSRHVAPSEPHQTRLGSEPARKPLTPTQQDFARLLDSARGADSSNSNGTPLVQKRGYTFQPAPKASSGNLDGHWERRLGKGLIAPDMTVDLHEHSLANAYARMDQALADAQARGARVLLLITGKARPAPHSHAAHGRERGAIRRAMQDWLMASRHAGDIAAVRNAHPRHGGEGALYIILKRRRR